MNDHQPDLQGHTIADKFVVTGRIGEGGFGTVYRAYDRTVGESRQVAIKVIAAHQSADPQAVDRFYREARLIGQLQSRSAVQLYEFGAHGHMLFIAMELVSGVTLRQVLDHGPITPDRAARITRQVLSVLAEAHPMGIVHRDLKPANIMITRDSLGEEEVRVLDFGIAKLLSRDERDATVQTAQGVVFGTPAYMAPEVFHQEPTTQSDIYALGVIMFEMLTGRRPFESRTAIGVAQKHIGEPVPDFMTPAGVPDALQNVVYRALAKSVADRFQTPREMASALAMAGGVSASQWSFDELPATRLIPSAPPSEPQPAPYDDRPSTTSFRGEIGEIGEVGDAEPVRGRRTMFVAMAAVLALGGVGAAIWAISQFDAESPTHRRPAAVGVPDAAPVVLEQIPVQERAPAAAPPAAAAAHTPTDAGVELPAPAPLEVPVAAPTKAKPTPPPARRRRSKPRSKPRPTVQANTPDWRSKIEFAEE